MNLKFKLGLIMIAIIAVVITGIAVMLLNTASGLTIGLNNDLVDAMGDGQANYWNGKQESHLSVLRTLADVMSGYAALPAESRRDQFDAMLSSVIQVNDDIITLYTVWKPNALDGMDARYINRIGSTATGQYAMAYTRENGMLEAQAAADAAVADADASMTHITGPDAKKQKLETPVLRKVNGKDTYLLRMMVPIIDPRAQEVAGAVGCLLDIGLIQNGLEQVLRENAVIAAMAIYDDTGFILASYAPDRVGKNLRDVDTIYGGRIQDAFQTVQRGENAMLSSYSPVLETNVEMNLKSFQIGASDKTWTVMIAVTEEFMLLEVYHMTRFTIILAAIAVIISAAIIFAVLTMSLPERSGKKSG